MQRELRLIVRVFGPGASSSDVRCTIVQHNFSLMTHKASAATRLSSVRPFAASSLPSAPGDTCPAADEASGTAGRSIGLSAAAVFKTRHRCNVFCESNAVVDGLDVHDINTDDGGSAGHLLRAHLHPATGRGAEVDNGLCIFKKLVHENTRC